MKGLQKVHIVIASGILLVIALVAHQFDIVIVKNSALLLATATAGYSIAKKAIQSARMKSFSIELLVTIAVIGALLIGEYVESAAVTFLFLFGAYLEARTLEKTRSSLKTLMDMAPLEAVVIENGEKVTRPIDQVNVGDHIIIQSGEKIAIDGAIFSGQAFINEAAITGESVPASKGRNDKVFSGTILDNGYIEVKAEKVGEDTAFAKIIEMIEDAQETKAKKQKFLERFAAIYTPGILVLSILVFIFTRNIEITLTFLVIACPGALVISAPVSIVAGIGNGARNGTLIKGGEIMEKFSEVDVVVFDKTGTLTKGKPNVTKLKSFGMENNILLKVAAEAEVISEHHLGQTIVKEAQNRGIVLEHNPVEFSVEKGHGLIATVNDTKIIIGTRKLMKKYNIHLDQEIESYAVAEEKGGNTAIFVGIRETIAGIISIADEVRQDAAETISELKANGIKQVYMLTGDNKFTAEKVATKLGIDQVFSEMLPEDKVNKIKQLQDQGFKVAMVGDGINDAPAIALADVGFAMGGVGTDVAMETSDVVLMSGKLSKIPYAHALSKATFKNMKQNMTVAVVTVVLLLIGVLMERIFLASGMLIHELSVLFVILNAIRLVRFKYKHKGVKVTIRTPVIDQQANRVRT